MKEKIFNECNIITDVDEILVCISPKWCRKLLEKRELFRPYFKVEILEEVEDNEYEFNKLVFSRPEFYMNKWLARENIEIPVEILKAYLDLHSDPFFYTDLEPTPVAVALSNLVKLKEVKKIYVISRQASNNSSTNSKLNLINSLFPSNKLEIRFIENNGKALKSEAIKDINIEHGFIFEDEISNIDDYLTNSPNIKNCTFYMPQYGYNIANESLLKKIKDKDIEFKIY